MKTSHCRNLLLILSVVPLSVHASQAPRPTPTIDFSSKSLTELRQYLQTNDIETLTPRSKQSFNDSISTAAARERLSQLFDAASAAPSDLPTMHPGVTPELFELAQRLPTITVILISRYVPAAAADQPNLRVLGYGPHGPFCSCPWPDSAAPSEQANPAQADAHDDATNTQEEDSASDLADIFQRMRARWSRQ